ncbi:reverse transcriptase domain-containing protein [Tanacetum coccineum]
MVLVDQEGKEYSHAIRLNFYASEDDMDYEALLVGLVASAGKGMKGLHVFVDSKFLVNQVEGNRVPRTEGAKRYREEIMGVTAPFHRHSVEAKDKLPEKARNVSKKAASGKSSPTWEDHSGSN